MQQNAEGGVRTGLHNSDIPVFSSLFEVGTGSTKALKQAVSFRVVVAYSRGGSTIGTMSPKPIVDSEMNAIKSMKWLNILKIKKKIQGA